MPNGVRTKILWVTIKPGSTGKLTIRGANLTGPGTTHQAVPGSSGPGGNYPSIVRIPTAGCWRLTVRSGAVSGTVTMRVVG